MSAIKAKALSVKVTPALVVALLALAVTLGGSAMAATKLIGSGGVKNNSLTSADLKDGAGVKGADVADGSLSGADVGDAGLAGSDVASDGLTGADVSESSLSAARVVARLGGASGASLAGLSAISVPNLAYTQAAGESDQYIAGGQVTFSSGCTGSRTATIYLLKDGLALTPDTVVGNANVADSTAGTRTRRFEISVTGGIGNPSSFRAAAAQPHQFVVLAGVTCGGGSGATLDSLDLDVVGYK